MAVVVDANLLVALATQDDRRPVVSAQFRAWENAGETLHAPSLIRYEVASALTRLLVAGMITAEQVDQVWPIVTDPRVALHEIEHGPEVIRTAARLGRHSAYDASYIELAGQLGAELWTLDGPLARNAAGLGFPVHLVGTT